MSEYAEPHFQPAAWAIPRPFRDTPSLRRQIGPGLSRLQADFARSMAIGAWARERPARLLALGLPAYAMDECLLECLLRLGWPLTGIDDAMLTLCWDSRWEFVAAGAFAPARYRPGPSYRERRRLELLLDAWERASLRLGAGTTRDTLAAKLEQASAEFSARLVVPADLLRRAAVERDAEAAAEDRLHARLREELIDLERTDDLRHLAIADALAGASDLRSAVLRHGTPSMRRAVAASCDQPPSIVARAQLEPLLARLRHHLWAAVDWSCQ